MRDGVARSARQSRTGFRRVHLVLDGPVEAAIEEDRVIMASRAPLTRLRSDHALHVFDGLPVELVVERSEVVHRAFPLLVDILVTAPARLRIHEEVRRDDAAHVGLGGRWKERRLRTAPLLVHGGRHNQRVPDSIVGVRTNFSVKCGRRGEDDQQRQASHVRITKTSARVAHDVGKKSQQRQRGHRDVGLEHPAVRRGVAKHRQEHACQRRDEEYTARPGHAPDQPQQHDPERHAQGQVQHHVTHVKDGGRSERRDICSVDQQ